ncbi:glutamyl-tRNA(Gln) amidotransferase subunit A [Capsulimonas corticalis]|uniref:Glutamyl-tRNA(Gln) amidotransferase subunit A n=1 Tax=Capsulimonas corticalis TaxID=2219043 RepID=A0A402CTJ6_9BACT|nr:Asp-tRNA(Asn)/Glu-tRNA(Gln) amidotransferase subunit GatA [Capsulimonas corticalis]BDI30708.1 glutamyl-tRNA(Gln) amidotransferase subunit A [Capsulimonas corticalis]
MELFELTAHELSDKIRAKEISAREVAQSVLDRVEAVESRVQSFVTVTREQALAQADAVDAKIAAGETVSAAAGIPLALKDNLCTIGVETTCSSKILRGFHPPYDATVVEKLKTSGSVFVGKANLDEFAMGSSTENSGLFPTRNPWNLDYVPGGSSGGSTASVAAGEAVWSLGSDTGGSIRQPAAYCGVVGLKPTYGRVSRYGLIAFASSLDQIGPITKDVRDAALLLGAISGHDDMDSTSIVRDVPDYTKALTGDVKGLRIGVPKEYFAQGVEGVIADAVRAAVDKLVSLGAIAEEVSLPHSEYALPTYYILAPAEASSNLARYDGVRFGHRTARATSHIDLFEKTREEGFGPEVKQRIMLGTYALSAGYYDAFYLKAQKVRTLIKRDFDQAFEKYDVLLSPTAPTVAFPIGQKTGDPLAMKLSDVLTIPANMAGIPAISLPCGFTNGLPIGLQIMAPAFGEEILLRAAHAYEQSTDWHTRRASL